jgi:(4S)-4-hydroxy-5-phosphonooxypentane-2,3-dione isomerase
MYVVVARFEAEEGMADEVANHLARMIPHALQEPGCAMYIVNRDQDDPNEFLLYEQYQDESAFQFHLSTEPFKEIVLGQVVPLLASRRREIYDVIEPAE